jgi:hypothetical protein
VIATAWDKGFVALETRLKSELISPGDQSDDTDDYRMNIDPPAFALAPQSRPSSATPELGSSLSSDVKKTGLRDEEYLRLKILTCMLPAI